jgi:hypothetical protein
VSDPRLPAHLEVAGLIRAAEAIGGFGTVLAKGERDAGAILLVTIEKGGATRLWERLPRLDGKRAFAVSRIDEENDFEFGSYLARRRERDRDLWIVELNVPDAERFIAQSCA